MASNVRHSVAQLRKLKSRSDLAQAAATTEAVVRQHMIEDGEDPDAPVENYLPANLAKHVRTKLGMSQRVFAEAIRVPLATVQNWEQMRVRPEPAARALLTALLHEPKAVLRALRSKAA
jgi:putative transcriptional regulator